MNTTKIVCMGDSLTEGILVAPTANWPHLLSLELGVEVINSGISGDTIAGMLARFHPMAIAHEPTHIIIMGGTNDLYLGLDDQLIISNILAMTKYARHYAIPFIIALPPPFYYAGPVPEHGLFLESAKLGKRIVAFQEKLRAVVLDKEIPMIDFSVNMPVDMFLEDGVHMNEKGHAYMVGVVEQVLRPLL